MTTLLLRLIEQESNTELNERHHAISSWASVVDQRIPIDFISKEFKGKNRVRIEEASGNTRPFLRKTQSEPILNDLCQYWLIRVELETRVYDRSRRNSLDGQHPGKMQRPTEENDKTSQVRTFEETKQMLLEFHNKFMKTPFSNGNAIQEDHQQDRNVNTEMYPDLVKRHPKNSNHYPQPKRRKSEPSLDKLGRYWELREQMNEKVYDRLRRYTFHGGSLKSIEQERLKLKEEENLYEPDSEEIKAKLLDFHKRFYDQPDPDNISEAEQLSPTGKPPAITSEDVDAKLQEANDLVNRLLDVFDLTTSSESDSTSDESDAESKPKYTTWSPMRKMAISSRKRNKKTRTWYGSSDSSDSDCSTDLGNIKNIFKFADGSPLLGSNKSRKPRSGIRSQNGKIRRRKLEKWIDNDNSSDDSSPYKRNFGQDRGEVSRSKRSKFSGNPCGRRRKGSSSSFYESPTPNEQKRHKQDSDNETLDFGRGRRHSKTGSDSGSSGVGRDDSRNLSGSGKTNKRRISGANSGPDDDPPCRPSPPRRKQPLLERIRSHGVGGEAYNRRIAGKPPLTQRFKAKAEQAKAHDRKKAQYKPAKSPLMERIKARAQEAKKYASIGPIQRVDAYGRRIPLLQRIKETAMVYSGRPYQGPKYAPRLPMKKAGGGIMSKLFFWR